MRWRVLVVLVVSACGIDAVGLAVDVELPPDRNDASTIDADALADADADPDDSAPDGAFDACSSCPVGFACSDGACTDYARTHFTLDANPSGGWTWGSRDKDASAGTFVPYTIGEVDSINGIEQWVAVTGTVTPGVFRNPSNMVIHPYASFTMTPLQMAFHPGPLNQRSIVRWTAPATRDFGARIVVVGLSGYNGAQPTTTGVTVTKTVDGGTSVLGSVNVGGDGGLGDAGIGPFTIDLAPAPFAQGDVLDIAVDFGTNGNYGFDSTGVDVTIVAP